MTTINQYGRTAEEIAIIIAEQNPHIEVTHMETENNSKEMDNRRRLKARKDALMKKAEDESLKDGTYESISVNLTAVPEKNMIGIKTKINSAWTGQTIKKFN